MHNPGPMKRLSSAARVRVVSCLAEGMGVRATHRVTGVSKNAILALLPKIGAACRRHHDRRVTNLQAERIQCDEVWAYCHAKDRNVPERLRGQPGIGSVWTWVALDADDKLVISWHVGMRTDRDAATFMYDLASRLDNRVQITSDGFSAYAPAVFGAFGKEVDYAMLMKVYAERPLGDMRFAPKLCVGATRVPVCGAPLTEDTSTSYVERSNLTLRMHQRRFTRLTNAFSKKMENLAHSVALHCVYYNFVRRHQTLGTTPAVASGLTDRAWVVSDLVELLEAEEKRR